MRTLRLPDASTWQLETVPDRPVARDGRPETTRSRDAARRTYVWVRCAGPDREFRLMFAATWEMWGDEPLARAIDAERDRAERDRAERDRFAAAPRAG